jgi:nucleotide-binding universal stress UspA family protein
MYKNILVPVDLTDKNLPAVEEALRLASRKNATITLLHVIETLDLPFEEIEDFYRQLAAKARRKLRHLGKQAAGRGVEMRYETTYGRRVHAILDHILDHRNDLVVITSDRIEPGDPASSWISISHQVALFADCSVMMVRIDQTGAEE